MNRSPNSQPPLTPPPHQKTKTKQVYEAESGILSSLFVPGLVSHGRPRPCSAAPGLHRVGEPGPKNVCQPKSDVGRPCKAHKATKNVLRMNFKHQNKKLWTDQCNSPSDGQMPQLSRQEQHPPYSDYAEGSADCEHTCISSACHTPLTVNVRQMFRL